MRFVFSRRFYILFALGLIPLSLSWNLPVLRYVALAYDVLLVALAFVDYFISRKLPEEFTVSREFERRFAIGDETQIHLKISNASANDFYIKIKDEFPPEMILGETREAEFKSEAQTVADFFYTLTPPKRGNYKFGKTAVRFFSKFGLVWCQTHSGRSGIGQSLSEYAAGARDGTQSTRRKFVFSGSEKINPARRRARVRINARLCARRRTAPISWTATARLNKLTTRQYQIERDQTIFIALDAGRLMTGRIGDETKFDTAIHASLALMSAAMRGGDNCGLMVFGRTVKKFLPPQKGIGQIDAVLESLYDLEPELIEPSYSRAFQFISANSKKRSFVVILTDLVDKESSKELINSLKLLRPRHLPLVATIGDRDLNATVSRKPENIEEVFTQSAAEEIIHQREAALRSVESLGGLALDVTTQTLAPRLLETYLRVKERGLL